MWVFFFIGGVLKQSGLRKRHRHPHYWVSIILQHLQFSLSGAATAFTFKDCGPVSPKNYLAMFDNLDRINL